MPPSDQVKKTGPSLLRFELKLAPRDALRLQSLLEGHDGLGALRPVDTRQGLFVLEVPASFATEAERALAAAAGRVPLRLLSVTPADGG